MASQSNPFSRIKLVYKRGNSVIKLVLLCTIVLSTITIVALSLALQDAKAQASNLQEQAAQLEQENQKLEEQIDGLGSVGSVEDIAQNELGLVNPDTVIIQPEG